MENIIGTKLQELRATRGLTQEEVASSLEISNKTLSKWENGSSEPSLDMLIKLSKYYETSIDSLLGLKTSPTSSIDLMKREMSDMSLEEAVSHSFKLSYELIRAKFGMIDHSYKSGIIPSDVSNSKDSAPRSYIQANSIFELFVNSKDTCFFVTLLGNDSNFSWLNSDEKLEKISKIFSFLSGKDALKIIKSIHTNGFSEKFSASFVSKEIGIDESSVSLALDKACEIGLCEKKIAHLKEQDATIYTSSGNGAILSLVTIAYEYMFGKKCNNYANHGSCKMIKEENS